MFQKTLRTVGTVVLAFLSFLSPQLLNAQAASSNASSLVVNRLTQPINEKSLVTLKGTVHPLARAVNDRGAAPDGMALDRLQIVLKRSDTQEAALKQLISDMHTPGKASYHKWLTPTQFGEQFGASDPDVLKVQTWLQSKGFAVAKVNPGKGTIEVSGNAGQFRDAFHAQIHKYQVNGEVHYANATDPQIPSALAPVFGGFASLNNFKAKRLSRTLGKATYDPKTDRAKPQWTTGDSNGVSFAVAPGDFAVQYDLNPLYSAGTNGSGQTIGIINDSNINIATVNTYRSLFGLSPNPPQVIIDGNDPGIDGVNNPDGPNGDSIEAYLDVEMAGAVAPNATVDLVIAADTSLEDGLILAAEHAVYTNIAPVLSMSFGFGCESQLGTTNTFLSELWEQAAAQGITVMVSSGDSGSAGCDGDSQYYAVGGLGISGLASTPYNVAVGGTDFYYSDYASGAASASNYWNQTPSNSSYSVSLQTPIPEQPWNDSQFGLNVGSVYNLDGVTTIAGGSGGVSACGNATEDTAGNVTCAGYAKPAWQTGAGVPNDKVRDIPDVSLFAADGLNYSFYPICAADADCQTGGSNIQVTGVGGTSASSPAFAGIMALVNQKYGPQGQADFVLYPMATQFPAAFHDVQSGNNSEPCNTTTVTDGTNIYTPVNCLSVSDPLTVTDPTYGETVEGQLGTGSTPGYNAGVGYDPASGLGSVDANVLVSNWGNVSFQPTNVTLTPSSTSFTHGTAVTFSGSVKATSGSGTPTGDVGLMTDSTEAGNQGEDFFTLTNGAFSNKSVSFLPGGTYNVWGHYGGDSTNAAADSEKTQITVSPENSTLTLSVNNVATGRVSGAGPIITSGATGISYGTQLELSALATPSSCGSQCTGYGIPTGTVAFTDGGKALNTAVINAEGDAEYNGNWTIGSHSVTAAYSGDNSYNKSSTASPFTFTVVKNTPSVSLYSDIQTQDQSLVGGQSTVVTIQVLNSANGGSESNYGLTYANPTAAPTGTVTLSGFPSGVPATATLQPVTDGATQSAAAVATVTLPASTSAKSYNVTVNYAGDGNYNTANASGAINVETVGGTATTTTASLSGSISPTTQVVLTGTVTGSSSHGAPTGSVLIYASGYILNQVAISSASATSSTFTTVLNSQLLLQGTNTITVQYLGDTNYGVSATTLSTSVSNPLSDFSMVPNTTIVPVSAGASATDPIQLASVNGFAGTVSYTCAAPAGITCTLGPNSTALTNGGASSTTLTITADATAANGANNILITGTSGLFTHTLGITAQVSNAVAPTTGFSLSLNPTSLTLNPGSGSGNAVVATVKGTGGFTGDVNLSATITGPDGATNPVAVPTFSQQTLDITGQTALSSIVNISTASATTPGDYTITVTGTSNNVIETATLNLTVSTATFAMSASPSTLTLAAGAATGNTSSISVTPSDGFTGTVNLTCSVASPSGANDPATCSIPSTLSVTGTTAATATVTVATTASTTTAMNRNTFFAVSGGIAVAGLLFFGIPARRRGWRTMLGVIVFAMIVGFGITGCGGGGSSSGSGGGGTTTPGTTAGTYTVTINGTSGSISQSTTVTVTVN